MSAVRLVDVVDALKFSVSFGVVGAVDAVAVAVVAAEANDATLLRLGGC